jgi:hypothetical protein
MKKLILAMALSAPLSAQAGEFEATERMFQAVLDVCKQRQENATNIGKILSRGILNTEQLADTAKFNQHYKSVILATGKALNDGKNLSSYYRHCVIDMVNAIDDLGKLNNSQMQEAINDIAVKAFDKL